MKGDGGGGRGRGERGSWRKKAELKDTQQGNTPGSGGRRIRN